MKIQEIKKKRRLRRKMHIRKQIFGTPEMPRLTVTKSLKHVYAQIIDDVNGQTLVSASTLQKDVKDLLKPESTKIEKSKLVGEAIARKALEKGIKKIAFDRNGYLYHGRIKALADAARKGGLEF
jgi:large subunit ribosomal protein L18